MTEQDVDARHKAGHDGEAGAWSALAHPVPLWPNRPMPTLSIALLQALKDHGAREIFGIPGDFVLPLFKVIEESKILPVFTLSHEPAVGFAADAAARYH